MNEKDKQSTCPLITQHTKEWDISEKSLRTMAAFREWTIPGGGEVPFRWPSRLRHRLHSVLRGRETDEEFVPKQFQLVMAQNMVRMPRFLNGDSVGLGKTVEAIIGSCIIRDRVDKLKIIVLGTKSTTGQWCEEFERFSTLRPKVLQDKYKKLHSYQARYAQFHDFLRSDDHDVLICKYTSLLGKRRKIEGKFDEEGYPTENGRERVSREVKQFLRILKPHGDDILLITDECQKYKTVGSQNRHMVQILARPCGRVWALTATVIKNTLEEFYSIASAIGIRPFGSYPEFQERFCLYRSVPLGGGRTKQVLRGYQNIKEFKAGMRPWFLGRSQRQVNEKLPRLVTRMYPIDLDEYQTQLLLEDIPSGKFQLPPKFVKVDGELVEKERDPDNKWTMLSLYQLVANHPALIDPANLKEFYTHTLSPKEEYLLDLLDGDLRGEKCVVYTKSRAWIDRLEKLTTDGRFTERKFLRITGSENEKKRILAKQLFQDPDSGHDLIVINSAATEGVNLQQSAHLICLDAPWGWGDLLQLVGRILRLASPHSLCTLHMFVAKGTVDEYTIDTLRSKKGLFERILGESHSAGLLDDRDIFDMESGMEQVVAESEFTDMLKAHIKEVSLGQFLGGQKLAEAAASPEYEMLYYPKSRKSKPSKQQDLAFIDEYDSRWG